MSSTYSEPAPSPVFGVHGSRTFCALIVMPRLRSMSIRSRYWARICRASMIPVTSSIRSASVDLPWSMWAMMQKFRIRAGSVAAGVVTVLPWSHADGVARGAASTGPACDSIRAVGAAHAAVRRLVDRPVALTSLWALACALAVEAAPVVGGDLAAQAWWRSWATSGVPPVDLGWYGGVPVVSYSFVSPWIAGLLGLPLMGALGTVLGAAATTALLARLHPPPTRLVAAGLVAGVTWAADEWSGRTTFGLGAALGCLALVVVCSPRGRVAGGLLAVLAGAVSPVAAVFLLLAAAAWVIGKARRPALLAVPPG